MADFAVWQHDTLVRFAKEANARMASQARQISHLELQLKNLNALHDDAMAKLRSHQWIEVGSRAEGRAMIPITAHWRPASALPKVRQPTTILIAYPPCDDGGPRGWYLSAHIYQVMPGGAIVSEVDDHDPTCSNFFWVFEHDLMTTIDAALPLEAKAATLNHESAWRDALMFPGNAKLTRGAEAVEEAADGSTSRRAFG